MSALCVANLYICGFLPEHNRHFRSYISLIARSKYELNSCNNQTGNFTARNAILNNFPDLNHTFFFSWRYNPHWGLYFIAL